jgi:hypothetical protein
MSSLSFSAVCVKTVRSEQKPELVFHFFGHRGGRQYFTQPRKACAVFGGLFLHWEWVNSILHPNLVSHPRKYMYGLFPTPHILYFCIPCAVPALLMGHNSASYE